MSEPAIYRRTRRQRVMWLLLGAAMLFFYSRRILTPSDCDGGPLCFDRILDFLFVGACLVILVVAMVNPLRVIISDAGVKVRRIVRTSIDWQDIDVVLAGMRHDVTIRLHSGRTLVVPVISSKFRNPILRDLRQRLGAERILEAPYRMSNEFVKCNNGWAVSAAAVAISAVLAYCSGAVVPVIGFACGLLSGLMMVRTARPTAPPDTNAAWATFGIGFVPFALVCAGLSCESSDDTIVAAFPAGFSSVLAGIFLAHAVYRRRVLDAWQQTGTPWADPDDPD